MIPAHLRSFPFILVDVFAERPLHGNPLAIVDEAATLSDDEMRAIAREFNQSETTFLLPPTRVEAARRLRSFTAAGVEVFGAGHNALGAWWWIAASGALALADGSSTIGQELGSDVLPVRIVVNRGAVARVIMTQSAPLWGQTVDDRAGLATALGLPQELVANDGLACRVVSTGAAHLLVPVQNPDAVDASAPDQGRLLPLLRAAGAQGCYVYSARARHPEADLYARFFNPTVGIVEDPATGTAAGPLVADLAMHGRLAGQTRVVVEQGTAAGRRSLIDVEIEGGRPHIGGRAVIVGKGQLTL